MNDPYHLAISTLGILLSSGIPLMLVTLSSILLWRNNTRNSSKLGSNNWLVGGVIFSALLWFCLYGEHYTNGAVEAFDLSAPLFSAIALIILPIIGFMDLVPRLVNRRSLPCLPALISSYLLLLVSLVPGICFFLTFILPTFCDRDYSQLLVFQPGLMRYFNANNFNHQAGYFSSNQD